MTEFPNKYKITGIQLNVSNLKHVTHRKTLMILAVFSRVGGLLRIVNLVASRFVAAFAKPTFFTLIANRLYTWEKPDTFKETGKAKIGPMLKDFDLDDIGDEVPTE